MPEPATYIVTGGAGFIGSGLVAALLARQPRPRVIVIDNFRSGSFANIVEACDRRGVGPFDGEVLARSTARLDWDRLLQRTLPAAVFYLAAITDTTVADEREMLRENTGGFRLLLLAAAARNHLDHRHPIRVVYASSAATYGSPPQARDRVPFPTDAAGRPNNVYGFSKWLMECIHRRVAPAAPVVGLRFFNVFGPGEARKGKMASMAYQLAQQLLSGDRPRLFTDGSQARDQVYIDDVVECTLAAAGLGQRPDPAPGVYNLGSGVATSFNAILAAVRRGLGIPECDRPTEYFDMPPAIRAFYQDYTCADLSATERGLGWRPRWKPETAAERYAAFLAAERRAPGAPASPPAL